MTRYQIVPATLEHAAELAPRMRHADVVELDAMGYEPYPALVRSMDESLAAFAGLADGRVVAMFGHCVKSMLSDEAFPWLLTSPDMPKHAKAFLRLNKEYIAGLRQQYRLLWGLVCETNAVSIRWLAWLGFTVDDDVRRLIPGKPGFRYFHLKG